MAEYLLEADLTNRLTDAGVKFVADRNRDSTIDAGETAAFVTTAIQYAGNIIDGYLCEQITPALARGAGNGWLRDRAVDIAAWRAASHGGRQVPKSLVDAYMAAIAELERIHSGGRIPSFNYPGPVNARFTTKTPKVANLHDRNQGRPGSCPY